MTNGTERRDRGPRPDYEVRYGKPPKETRFKKGVSGNPRGRPRGAKTKRPALHEERLKDIILDEAYRTISVRDGDRNVTIPMAQAVVRSLAVNAAKGQHRAQKLFSELLSSAERTRKAQHDEWFATALTYKLEWEAELDRREKLGITDLPEPLPHPDQIKVDMRKGTIRTVGPITREEQEFVEEWKARKVLIAESVAGLKEDLLLETDPEERVDIQRYIDRGEKLLANIGKAIPE